jgi:hypothetical protein
VWRDYEQLRLEIAAVPGRIAFPIIATPTLAGIHAAYGLFGQGLVYRAVTT